MKKIKILALCTVLVMITIFAAGCTKGEQTGGNSSKKVLTMATNATFPPYEYYESNKIVGIDAEIAEEIAKKLNMTLKIEDMEFNSIISAVQSGKADMGLAGMTVSEERKRNVNFSDSYATGIQVVITKKGGTVTSLDTLKGKKIGVQENTTGDIFSTDDFGDEFIERYNKGTDAVKALSQGKVDAVIIDNEPAKAFIKGNDNLEILKTEYAKENYAIAISKENEDLLKNVNKAMAELKSEGKLDKIIKKYIPAE